MDNSSTKQMTRADSKVAETWVKAQVTSIRERYGKLMSTIESWETKRKREAARKRQKEEAELDRKKAKAVQSYQEKIRRIEKIARGARAQAVENRRQEEFKAMQKAIKIASTGKLPPRCLCF